MVTSCIFPETERHNDPFHLQMLPYFLVVTSSCLLYPKVDQGCSKAGLAQGKVRKCLGVEGAISKDGILTRFLQV